MSIVAGLLGSVSLRALIGASMSVSAGPVGTSVPAVFGRVQGGIHQNGSTASLTIVLTLPATVGVGNALMVSVGFASATTTISSITDDKGNTGYTTADRNASSADGYTWVSVYRLNLTNAPRTLTVTLSASTSYGAVIVDEFSGISPSATLDGHSTTRTAAGGTGTNHISSGNITTTAGGDLVYSSCVNVLGSGALSVGTGYTSGVVSGNDFLTEYQVQGGATTVAGTFTNASASDPFIASVMAFRAPAIAGAAMVSAAGTIFTSPHVAALAGAGMTTAAGGIARAGGYNNLTNIPGAANRPTTSGSTLSWIGPVGGGASTSSDTAQTLSLTVSSTITSTSAGQTISGFDVTGQINVNHNNVTVRACHVKASSANNGNAYQVWINTGVTGTIIEDCELDGFSTSGSVGGNGNISGPSFAIDTVTVRRCNLHNSEQCIRYQLNHITFIDNWCHHIYGLDCDMVECYPVGSDANNNLIQHNCFDGTVQVNLNSSINFTNGFSGTPGNIGPNTNVVGNYFINGGTFFAICDDNTQGTGTVSWNPTNNGFYITNGGRERRDNTTTPTNSGNFNMATTTSTSGTPSNGSGAI